MGRGRRGRSHDGFTQRHSVGYNHGHEAVIDEDSDHDHDLSRSCGAEVPTGGRFFGPVPPPTSQLPGRRQIPSQVRPCSCTATGPAVATNLDGRHLLALQGIPA